MPATKRKANPEHAGAPIALLPLREGVPFPGVIHTQHIVRESTKRALRAANERDGMLLCVGQADGRIEDPQPSDLYRVGVLCEVLQASPLPDGSLRAVLRASARASWEAVERSNGVHWASYTRLEDVERPSEELEALCRETSRQFATLVETHDSIPPECATAISHAETAGAVADLIAYHFPAPLSKRQQLLETIDVSKRLQTLLAEISRESKLHSLQRDVAKRVDSAFGESQRELYLREQMRAIRTELGDNDAQSESEGWRAKIEAAELPELARIRAYEQLDKLERLTSSSPEGSSARDYLDWIVSMPWHRRSDSGLNLEQASQALDSRHFGIESVKERILEFLAVQKLTHGLRGPILCFVGPPGVGKSSAASSIADAMGRKFARIALGGIRDEAELRGHRRTYVGAMPGRLLKEIRSCGCNDPVILLDEIDKLSRDWRGDPASVLLEILDPVMNESFVDHFLEIPFSLRNVVFVATANTVDGILPALYDRLEVVEFSSYTESERLEIARRHLVPDQVVEHGLVASDIEISDAAMRILAGDYSSEPGVRQLEQRIAALCRKSARAIAEGADRPVRIDRAVVERWLGPAENWGSAVGSDREGRCIGLAVSSNGGMAMPIEATILEPIGAQPSILVTGNPGDVMKESAHAAMTYLRKNLVKLGIEGSMAKDIHVHVGEGAVPKDGPSAGLPMALALASAATRKPIPGSLAASGEVGIHGDIRPVGGLREKLIAAKRERITKVLLPKRNATEVSRLPQDVQTGIEIVFVSTIEEAILATQAPARAVVSIAGPPEALQEATPRTARSRTN